MMLPPRRELEQIVETIPDGVIILDRDGFITFANATAEKLLGLTRSQIVGRAYNAAEWKRTAIDGRLFPEEKLPFVQVMRTGKPIHGVEVAFEHPDGIRTVLSINAAPLNDEEGGITGVVASLTDITERKKVEEEREEIAKRMQLVLQSTTEGIFLIGTNGLCSFFNKAASEMTGFSPEETIGSNIHSLIHHSYADGTPFPLEECPIYLSFNAGKGVHVDDEVFWKKDGTPFPVEYTSSLAVENGVVKGAVVTFTDMTERKRAAEALKESERRFREMLEEVSLTAVTIDVKGRITFINDFLLNLTGWQRDEVIGKDWFDIFIPEDQREQVRNFFFDSIAKGKIQAHYENDIITNWGENRTISFTNVLLRDSKGLVIGSASIGHDITEEKRVTQEINESRKQVLDILESISDGFFAVDNDWRFTYVNHMAEELLSRRKEELLFRSMWEAFPEVVGTKFYEVFNSAKEKMLPLSVEEFYAPLSKWFEVHVYPYKNGLSGYFSDVTERNQIEEERNQLINRMQLLLQPTDEGIYGVDTKEHCTFINKAASEMLGYKPEEILGKNIHELIHYKYADGLPYPVDECPIYQAYQTGQGVRLDTQVFWRKDGTSFPVECSSYPIAEGGVIRGAVVSFTDITGRKQAQKLSDALNDINKSITSTLDFNEIMQRVVVESAKAVGCETAAIDTYENHQWVTKYIYGFPEEVRGVALTDEEAPHAALAAKTRRQVVINNALYDTHVNRKIMERFNIKSVMVTPLVVRDEVVGTLFFNYHSAPVSFTDAQVDFANKVATGVSLALENARLYGAQRNIADTLQSALLAVPENIPGLTYGTLYRSATEAARVGGDFYDTFEIEHGKVGVIIGDVAGKGIEAAALTIVVKNTIKAYTYEDATPALVMTKTNDFITRISPPDNFVTVFFGVVDMQTSTLTYCNAGHPPAIIKRKSGAVELLEEYSPVIGAFAGMHYRDAKATFQEGDILLLYTDGIVEARCSDGEFFGEERLVELIKNLPEGAREMPQAIFDTVTGCTGGILSDDVALLSLAR